MWVGYVVHAAGLPGLERGLARRQGTEAAGAVLIVTATGFGGVMLAAGGRPVGVDYIVRKTVTIAALGKAISGFHDGSEAGRRG
jgi:hypothetical protein